MHCNIKISRLLVYDKSESLIWLCVYPFIAAEAEDKPIVEAYDHKTDDEFKGHKLNKVQEHKEAQGAQENEADNVAAEPPMAPTPAAHVNGNSGLHPIQNAASMADVYFLGKIGGYRMWCDDEQVLCQLQIWKDTFCSHECP